MAQACGEGAGPCVLPKIEGCATGSGLDYSMLSGCVGDKKLANRLQHEFGACVAPRECLEPSGGPDSPPSRDDRLQCLSPSPLACRLAAAALTPSDHSYVPWVVVEGKPLKNSEALVKHVCQKYRGANKPAACAKAEAQTVADAAFTSSNAACPAAW